MSKQAERPVAKMQRAQAVATGVVGDAMRKICAHVFDAEPVDEELAQLVDAGQQRGELVAQSFVAQFFKQCRSTDRGSWPRRRKKE